MQLDAKPDGCSQVLTARNSESFKGCNDLHIASNGDVYFTDQGQPGCTIDRAGVSALTRGQTGLPDRSGVSPTACA